MRHSIPKSTCRMQSDIRSLYIFSESYILAPLPRLHSPRSTCQHRGWISTLMTFAQNFMNSCLQSIALYSKNCAQFSISFDLSNYAKNRGEISSHHLINPFAPSTLNPPSPSYPYLAGNIPSNCAAPSTGNIHSILCAV